MGIRELLALRRAHLFEFEDQSWFPNTLRDYGTDYMRFVVKLTKPYRGITPKLRVALDRTGTNRILDLCSGGSGPIEDVASHLSVLGGRVPITLTDKYPNKAAFLLVRNSWGREHRLYS